ncbi:hypothetical protein KT71_09042 [Congregibacter litoralis KT71]|uniref:DUF4145 domain-containing protein n=1 Tax=Congregibacter litoralis KT71 TaxID=314285 RepID=A4A4N9_9GAMM|nr:hypothetical protein KT71_09042 [Congregibacter litoralis KT71]
MLGVVVRGHLYLEAAILTIVECLLPYPSEINLDRARFGLKLDLAHALGLSSDLRAPLLAVDKIRNKFAHNPYAQLGSDSINALYGSLSAKDREMLLQAFESTERQVEKPLEVEFRKLGEKEQFLFIVVTLHTLLVVVIDEAKNRQRTHNKSGLGTA